MHQLSLLNQLMLVIGSTERPFTTPIILLYYYYLARMPLMFHLLKRKLRYYFISPLDQTLDTFRKNNPKTASQQSEITKYQKISAQRDAKPNVMSD